MQTQYYTISDNKSIMAWKGLYLDEVFYDCYSPIVIGAVSYEEDITNNPKPSGMLIADLIGDYLELRWLYVALQYRRKKIATNMLSQLINSAKKTYLIDGIHMVISESHDGMTQFFDSVGIRISFNGIEGEYRAFLNNARDLGVTKKGEITNVISITEVSDTLLKNFNHKLSTLDVQCGERLPLRKERYDEDSLVYVENNAIKAIVLIDSDLSKPYLPVITIKWLCSVASPKNLAYLLMELEIRLKTKYSESAVISATILNDDSNKLMRKIFPSGGLIRMNSDFYRLESFII